MKLLAYACLLGATACVCAQTSETGAELLEKARHLQDAPFARGLQSFTCDVQFDWAQHFREAPRVGDEGTDEQVRTLIQPIKTRVTVSSRGAIPESGLSEAEERQLPFGGMAEGLLKHAVQFSLNQWLMTANNQLLPPVGTNVSVETTARGIAMHFPMQNTQAQALLTPDLRLQQVNAQGDDTDRLETKFLSGPSGFTVTYLAVGEDGKFAPGNRIIATYTYQQVHGFQLPAQVVLNRESHREVWHYTLTGCSVSSSK